MSGCRRVPIRAVPSCERGGSPPFTLSPRIRPTANKVRCHLFFARSGRTTAGTRWPQAEPTTTSATALTAWNAGFSRHPRPERAAESAISLSCAAETPRSTRPGGGAARCGQGSLSNVTKRAPHPRVRAAIRAVPFVKGGPAPLSHFPPKSADSEHGSLPFCLSLVQVEQRRGPPPGGLAAKTPRSAGFQPASRSERTAKPDNPTTATRFGTLWERGGKAPSTTRSAIRAVPSCERGASPPFTLSPRIRPTANTVRCHFVCPPSRWNNGGGPHREDWPLGPAQRTAQSHPLAQPKRLGTPASAGTRGPRGPRNQTTPPSSTAHPVRDRRPPVGTRPAGPQPR